MFGSKPFMFKRSTSERGLNEGALSAAATESAAVVLARLLLLCVYIAHAISVRY